MWLDIASSAFLAVGTVLLVLAWRDLEKRRKDGSPVEDAVVRAMKAVLVDAGSQRIGLAEENRKLKLEVKTLRERLDCLEASVFQRILRIEALRHLPPEEPNPGKL